MWVVVISVDDEPPKAPVITGVVGPFQSGELAEMWALRWIEKCKRNAAPNKSPSSFVVTPLIHPSLKITE